MNTKDLTDNLNRISIALQAQTTELLKRAAQADRPEVQLFASSLSLLGIQLDNIILAIKEAGEL